MIVVRASRFHHVSLPHCLTFHHMCNYELSSLIQFDRYIVLYHSRNEERHIQDKVEMNELKTRGGNKYVLNYCCYSCFFTHLPLRAHCYCIEKQTQLATEHFQKNVKHHILSTSKS